MWPLIESGDAITISPIARGEEIEVGDIVAANVSRGRNRYFYVHMVLEVQTDPLASRMSQKEVMMHLFGNAKGRVNGSASRADVRGKVKSAQQVWGADTDHPVYQDRTGHLSPQTLREADAKANEIRRSACPDRQRQCYRGHWR